MPTLAEENYLKAIFKIAEKELKSVSTNAIAKQMSTSAASVSDMLKKLSEKELINYEKYRGVTLTQMGNHAATQLIRKHRLWEVFLVEKLRFRWDQVHDIAEELEHINSDELIRRLDIYLGKPKFDPHGDPIPNAEGKFTIRNQMSFVDLRKGQSGILVGVKEHSTPFLEYLNSIEISLGTSFEIIDIQEYDQSVKALINNKQEHTLTQAVAQNLLVKKI